MRQKLPGILLLLALCAALAAGCSRSEDAMSWPQNNQAPAEMEDAADTPPESHPPVHMADAANTPPESQPPADISIQRSWPSWLVGAWEYENGMVPTGIAFSQEIFEDGTVIVSALTYDVGTMIDRYDPGAWWVENEDWLVFEFEVGKIYYKIEDHTDDVISLRYSTSSWSTEASFGRVPGNMDEDRSTPEEILRLFIGEWERVLPKAGEDDSCYPERISVYDWGSPEVKITVDGVDYWGQWEVTDSSIRFDSFDGYRDLEYFVQVNEERAALRHISYSNPLPGQVGPSKLSSRGFYVLRDRNDH